MPLYEYKCQQCGRLTEKRQKFSDPELTECPHCHGPLERVISAPAVSFKGSGWYKDLYSSPKPASAPSSTAASTEGSSSSGSANGNGNSPASSSGSSSGATSSTTNSSPAPSGPAKP